MVRATTGVRPDRRGCGDVFSAPEEGAVVVVVVVAAAAASAAPPRDRPTGLFGASPSASASVASPPTDSESDSESSDATVAPAPARGDDVDVVSPSPGPFAASPPASRRTMMKSAGVSFLFSANQSGFFSQWIMQWYRIMDARFTLLKQKGQSTISSFEPPGGPEPLYAKPGGSSGSARGGYGAASSEARSV